MGGGGWNICFGECVKKSSGEVKGFVGSMKGLEDVENYYL